MEQILAVLGQLPEGALDSFSDLANNAELIARNIAVTLGVTFDVALEIVRRFAEQAGVDISDVGTTAADVGEEIIQGFSGTETDLTNIFFQLASLGAEAFENIRTNADGSLRLVDDQAQARLLSIVEAFGGTEQDVQVILRALAENSDLTFREILFSGAFAFENLSAEAIARLSDILTELGFTAEEIATLFDGISSDGTTSLQELETQSAVILSSMLAGFGFTGEQITEILNTISEDGETSFSSIEGAAGEALQEILADFGLSQEQIQAILDQIGLGADSVFAEIANRGGQTPEEIQEAFRAALEIIAGLFGNLGDVTQEELEALGFDAETVTALIAALFDDATGSASQSIANLGSQAEQVFNAISDDSSSAANQLLNSFNNSINGVAGSLTGLSNSASSTFNSIRSQAQAAIGQINALRGSAGTTGRPTGPVPLAKGGVISGRTSLFNPAGDLSQSAFRSGGLIPSPTFLGGSAGAGNFAVAGEAGEELLFPSVRNPDGELAVKAVLPPDLRGGGGPVVVNEFNIDARGASNETIDKLTQMISDVERRQPEIAAQTTARMMRGVVRV